MTEGNTRFWIGMFVALVFVCGISIGLAVSVWIAPRGASADRGGFRPAGPPPRPPVLVSERILDRLEREADVTDDQRDQLERLFEERERRFREFNRDMRARFETEQASLREEIAAILSPEQMTIFDSVRRPWRGRLGLDGRRDRERPRAP